ncbi:hypothetical protein LI410_mgp058 (mitochondrion) [Apium graveolens]|uniref:hypothetical protein n=1 Tax=Apium graveolens TaxID=4045 RepID=UPI001D01477E|nr:hypothetical protein LI410_mgp101 [Apium graveolens]YP_010185168.1 hypothetical protein LI410_mgp058 [Apium graveolens]QVJ97883.1 hypothetical protein [Apium graveolens]QVJ97925.1 hypothetical protein [Apium graveolens]
MHRGRERTSYIPFLLNPETRSDVIPVRLRFRETIPQARQPISHRKVCVNNGMVSITHFKVSRGDIISFLENDARARGEEIRRSFYIEISVEKIIGKFRDHPVRMWRRTKTEWFRLLKTKRGCRLLLKDRFLQHTDKIASYPYYYNTITHYIRYTYLVRLQRFLFMLLMAYFVLTSLFIIFINMADLFPSIREMLIPSLSSVQQPLCVFPNEPDCELRLGRLPEQRPLLDGAGPSSSHQGGGSQVRNSGLETSIQKRIFSLQPDLKQDPLCPYLLGHSSVDYWKEVKEALLSNSSQREYSRLLQFEARDLEMRELKNECSSLFHSILSANPDLANKTPYKPQEVFDDFLDAYRDRIEKEVGLGPVIEKDKQELHFLHSLKKTLKEGSSAYTFIKKQIFGDGTG